MIALTTPVPQVVSTTAVRISPRYWLFGGEYFYPNGGMEDFIGKFSTLREAKAAVTNQEWAHILDEPAMQIVLIYKADYRLSKSEWWSVPD